MENTPWQVHTGTWSHRYPWWVGRYRDGLREYHANAAGDVHKFKNLEAAQKVADNLQVKADFDDSREHMRLAVHHMLRATDHLQPTDPKMAILAKMSDLYLELTGQQL